MRAATIRWPSRALSRCVVQWRRSISYQGKRADPLRILFCGSDEFSLPALRRLHEAYSREKDFIESIDVFAKYGKKAGRGLKAVREVPIVNEARELALPLHQASTFTGWQPPRPPNGPFNLVIAVSFGLLVPSRILGAMKYGGINLHPSLLPEFRGPAPLHHTILQGKEVTGITLQTLHETHYDRGLILAQEPFNLPAPNICTTDELRANLAPVAADFLMRQLKQLVFVDPVHIQPAAQESFARKIDQSEAHVDWNTWASDYIMRMARTMGSVWSLADFPTKRGPVERRIKLQGLRPYQTHVTSLNDTLQPGQIGSIWGDAGANWTPIIKTVDNRLVVPTTIVVEGGPGPKEPGLALEKSWFEGRFLR